jgi:hypothetical protein
VLVNHQVKLVKFGQTNKLTRHAVLSPNLLLNTYHLLQLEGEPSLLLQLTCFSKVMLRQPFARRARLLRAMPWASGSVCHARFMSVRPEPQHADTLTAVGTRRIFTEEHDMLRESARKFFNDRVLPFHAQWEKDGYALVVAVFALFFIWRYYRPN